MIQLSYFEPETARWQHGDITQLPKQVPADARLWIDLNNATVEEQQMVLQRFGILDNLVEDFIRERHPPKCEGQTDFTLLVLRGYADIDFSEYTASAQINLLYSRQVLISKITSHNSSLLEQLKPKIEQAKTANISEWIKQIILVTSSSYLEKLIAFEDEISDLEDAMLQRGNDDLMALIMRYRSVLRKINRNLAYQKDIFAEAFDEQQSPLLAHFDTIELRDFYEKIERSHSMTDMYYDQLSDLVDSYLSTTSHQINERMKVLTIVSTIFIPLTFIAGIYGMNFVNMPELAMTNGYYIAISAMAVGGIFGLAWFKYRGWW
ncbi:magnesium transporter CorA family protein [Rheinheimera salexigens]|uniref:Magnesium transporter n=1 Tax=Rheinheimera salexigens TaxID=1628148 RepID=A0A1E7Q5F0_9GAMM|nr:magnesium transporter CorA family protein [Rheinheimera salexigens]OEY69331.1 magnesium transporter [Rheinheimera salexigens]